MNEPEAPQDSDPSEDLPPTLPVAGRQSGDLHGLDPKDLIAGGLEPQTVKPAWQPPAPEELSRLLPQYEIDAFLGRGGMGAVYRGRQVTLDRRVAIKLLPAELTSDAEFVARFEREARTLAKLHHPGIVLVHDFGQTSEGHLYFVMEFVDGTDLHKIIHGPGLECGQALEIITQICDALQYAHAQGVVHRDIKPANVILSLDGRAKLADFGLARPLEDGSGAFTRSNVVMGTPDYMAPEALAGEADHRADLYSLGVMLYEMLTGRAPRGAWAPPSQRVQVDVRLDEVVIRALQEDRELRYQQASEIKSDVEVIRTTPLPKAGRGKIAEEAPGGLATPLPKLKMRMRSLILAFSISLPLLALAWGMISKRESASPVQPSIASFSWQPVEQESRDWKDGKLAMQDGWAEPAPGEFRRWQQSSRQFRNLALRVHYQWGPNAKTGSLGLLSRMQVDGFKPTVTVWPNEIVLHLGQIPGGVKNEARRLKFPQPLPSGHEGTLEMAVIGERVVVRFDGRVVFDVVQRELNAQGFFEVRADGIRTRDFACLDLDGITDPLKALGWEVLSETTANSNETWQDLLAEHLAETPAAKGQVEFRHGTVSFRREGDSWRVRGKANHFGLTRPTTARESVRATATIGSDSKFAVFLRSQKNEGKSSYYSGWLSPNGSGNLSVRKDGGPLVVLKSFKPLEEFDPSSRHVVELRIVDDQIALLVDGTEVASATDALLPPGGEVAFYVEGEALLHAFEYRSLPRESTLESSTNARLETPDTTDAPPQATSTNTSPGGATREVPFINSLGMKFVPVPITGGPTDGKRVLFSIWETRVKDYEAFLKERGHSWSQQSDLEQGPDHAVVCVNWDDAQAFCTWLTERERNAGRLRAEDIYRLPSDHEWSCAVGIGDREDAAKMPQEKNQRLAGVFPWGNDWPPASMNGNYSSEELRPILAEGKFRYVKGEVPGYRDGQTTVGPVGGYAQNDLGLFDLGGNVWEWCEDWYNNTQRERVLRGASWHNHDRGDLLSSHRWTMSPDNRGFSQGGFRCVLALEARKFAMPVTPVLQKPSGSEVDSGAQGAEIPWQDFLAELADGPHKNAQLGQVWTREGSGWKVGHYHLFTLPDDIGRDLAIRMTVTIAPGGGSSGPNGIVLSARSKEGSAYTGRLFNTGSSRIERGGTALKGFKPIPEFDSASSHTLELLTQGDLITLLVDGIEQGSVLDSTLSAGGLFGVGAAAGSLIEKVEYRFLDSN